MHKKLFFLIFVILLVSGCNFTAKTKNDEKKTVEGIITGTTGLDLKFSKLPDKILLGQTFDIPVLLENKGKADIENAILVLSGYNEEYIKIANSKIEGINLKGVDLFSRMGERTIRSFSVIKTIPPISDYKANFVVTACYKYQTQASPTICINPKLFTQGVASKGECSNIDATLSSQGAPLAVTKVESWFGADASFWEFRIFVENKGPGKIVDENAYSKYCLGESLEASDLEKVKIEVYLGGKQIKCSIDGFQTTADSFVLSERKGEIRCRTDIRETRSSYTTPLTIILSYGYIDAISTQIPMVKKIL